MNLLLAPHNDDEALFAAFTCLRYRPHVIVCLRSEVQAERGYGVTYKQREAETGAAMEILGCEWEQWPYSDSRPIPRDFRMLLDNRDAHLRYEHVFAPAVEDGGHEQHNRIGKIADAVFGVRVTHYLTYTNKGKSSGGVQVEFEPGWVEVKLRALACYTSQARLPDCAPHFLREQFEYYTEKPR